MNKIKILPQVTVYRDILSENDIEFLLNQIYKSQNEIENVEKTIPEESSYNDFHGVQPKDRNDGTLIQTWTPWYTFGLRSIWSTPSITTKDKEHVDGYEMIKKALAIAHEDYIGSLNGDQYWTYDIKEWDILASENEDASSMQLSTFEILQHRLNLESDYTIAVHTDWHDQRKEEPGPKQILTYTIYLNDDYEGGEIDFVDEKNEHMVVYKPKRGDITVFPSGRPYWHGARAVKSDPNKIFIRTFAMHRSAGTKEWNLGAKRYGLKQWLEIQDEKIKKYIDQGNVGRQVVFYGDQPNISSNTVPIYIKDSEYLDGRKI
jgi:hypothetical protein